MCVYVCVYMNMGYMCRCVYWYVCVVYVYLWCVWFVYVYGLCVCVVWDVCKSLYAYIVVCVCGICMRYNVSSEHEIQCIFGT